MKPSFYALFKRGRYSGLVCDGNGIVEPAAARQRERFAAAVLAFCMRHDADFRRRFWEKICRVPGDPTQMPPITSHEVALEPWACADLCLTSDSGTERFMWVIETKAGAPLQPKQNPKHDEFKAPGIGYGAQLCSNNAGARRKLRYIVLGAEESLQIPDGSEQLGIAIQERKWSHLLQCLPKVGLTQDLADTFAELKIGEFYMEKARSLRVTESIKDTVKALTVVNAFCHQFGGSQRRTFNHVLFDDGHACFGYYLNQPPSDATKEYLELRNATRDTACVAWFGYEISAKGEARRAAWFYLNSETKRDKLKEKLEKVFPFVEPKHDGKDVCVVVSSGLDQPEGDFDWFQSVVNCVIKK